MRDAKSIMPHLRNLELDRQSVQFLHDEISRLTDIKKGLPANRQKALEDEIRDLKFRLLLTVNHVGRVERLLQCLTPEEQLVIDRMILHPSKNVTFSLMEQLNCERTTIYKFRNRAITKLTRLWYGAGE